MRNMSFALTTSQIIAHTKFVTRRLGWENLKPGELFRAMKKCQGLKKGEHPEQIALLRCDSNKSEPLSNITDDMKYGRSEVRLEGFENLMTPNEFVEMFCDHNKIYPTRSIQRIQFSYVIDVESESLPLSPLVIPGREVEWKISRNSSGNSAIVKSIHPLTIHDTAVSGLIGQIYPEQISRIFISAP